VGFAGVVAVGGGLVGFGGVVGVGGGTVGVGGAAGCRTTWTGGDAVGTPACSAVDFTGIVGVGGVVEVGAVVGVGVLPPGNGTTRPSATPITIRNSAPTASDAILSGVRLERTGRCPGPGCGGA
jgi:hypothetical protein